MYWLFSRLWSSKGLSCNRLIGMCRWMEWHFHDWIDYNGVEFSIELLEQGSNFQDCGGAKFWYRGF